MVELLRAEGRRPVHNIEGLVVKEEEEEEEGTQCDEHEYVQNESYMY